MPSRHFRPAVRTLRESSRRPKAERTRRCRRHPLPGCPRTSKLLRASTIHCAASTGSPARTASLLVAPRSSPTSAACFCAHCLSWPKRGALESPTSLIHPSPTYQETVMTREFRPMTNPICRGRPLGRPAGKPKRSSGCGKLRRTHHNWCGGTDETTQPFAEIAPRGGATAREDRRKPGVERRNAVRDGKNSSKILLTEFGYSNDTPVAPVTAFQ